jgi:hypothetical protein
MKKIIFWPKSASSIVILVLVSVLQMGRIEAEESSKDTVLKINKTPDFEISGKGDNPAWQYTGWIKLTKAGESLNYNTEIKILYSDSGIYCLFNCQDSKITATLEGDFLDLYNEDVVEAFFWPEDTIPIYFEYELSPLNFELPILVPNMNGKFWGWRPWHYEAGRKSRHATHLIYGKSNENMLLGWTAEFFIPFKLLKPLTNVPPVTGTRWHANFYRIDYDKPGNEWFWQPVRINFHDYKKFGTILFN